jgi:hypothetical protein
LGRLLNERDDASGARVVLLSHAFWQPAFGGGSLLVTPVLQSMLIDLPANDPATFAVISILLVAISLAARSPPQGRRRRSNLGGSTRRRWE